MKTNPHCLSRSSDGFRWFLVYKAGSSHTGNLQHHCWHYFIDRLAHLFCAVDVVSHSYPHLGGLRPLLSQLPTTPYCPPASVLHSCLRISPCPPFACHSLPRRSTLCLYLLSPAPSSLHHGQSQEPTTGILPNVIPSRSRHRIRFPGHCLRHPDLVLFKVKRRWI